MPRTKNIRTNPGRIQSLPKTTINEIRCGILRRPNYYSKITQDNHYNVTTQRTRGQKQNDSGSQTVLVTTTDSGHTAKMRRVHPVQNGR